MKLIQRYSIDEGCCDPRCDMEPLPDGTWVMWDDVDAMTRAAPDLYEALVGIIEIGKRDLSNPKYDSYFNAARAALAKAKGETK